MFGYRGDPRACIGDIRVQLPSYRPTGVFLGKRGSHSVIVFLVFDPAPRIFVRIPDISPGGNEDEGTRGMRKSGPRERLFVGILDEVATQREREISTSGIPDKDDIFRGVAEFDEVHISVE